MKTIVFHSSGEACSYALGLGIGEMLAPGDILALRGDLGAGKTFLARGIAHGLGVPKRIPVTSPTFTFINEYEGRLRVYHIDLYRLKDPADMETLPWEEALFGDGIALIEWPERMGSYLPRERWEIGIEITGDETRTVRITTPGQDRFARMESWAAAVAAIQAGPDCLPNGGGPAAV